MYVVKQTRAFPPEFTVHDHEDGHGNGVNAIDFRGPDAKDLAEEYAAMKNAPKEPQPEVASLNAEPAEPNPEPAQSSADPADMSASVDLAEPSADEANNASKEHESE